MKTMGGESGGGGYIFYTPMHQGHSTPPPPSPMDKHRPPVAQLDMRGTRTSKEAPRFQMQASLEQVPSPRQLECHGCVEG